MKHISLAGLIFLGAVSAAAAAPPMSPPQGPTIEQMQALAQSYREQRDASADQVAQLNAMLMLNRKELADLQKKLEESQKPTPDSSASKPPGK